MNQNESVPLLRDWFGRNYPANAQARHSPTLGEPIQDDHGILIDIVNKLCSWHHPPSGISGWHALCVNVARINFIQHQGALSFSCNSTPIFQLLSFYQLTCWIAGIRQPQNRKTTAHDFAPQLLQGDGEIVLRIQGNWDRIDRLELAQQLCIGLSWSKDISVKLN